MKVIVTGAAGFIGSTVSRLLLARGDEVIGIDNLNDYYDVRLKQARLDRLNQQTNFTFRKADVADRNAMMQLFKDADSERVVHLAAQAGVRYSIENPYAYIEANIVGFLNILEAARHLGTEHLVYASTSSVYGANVNLPFSVRDNVDHPVSLYAATKKSNELMAHCYSHLYEIPTTGLRFFTVYGPWGRPDMALFLFTRNILAGKPIDVFNYGHHRRDFTYVDDIANGVIRVLDQPAQPNAQRQTTVTTPSAARPDPASSASAPYRIYNIGNNNAVELSRYIEVLEQCLGKKAEKNLLPLQAGDVPDTFADVDALVEDFDYRPDTPIEVGIQRFVDWYRDYYEI